MSAVLSLAHGDVWGWSAAIRAMAGTQACGPEGSVSLKMVSAITR